MDYTNLVIGMIATGVTIGIAGVGNMIMAHQRMSRLERGQEDIVSEMKREHEENRQEHRDLFSKANKIDKEIHGLTSTLKGRGVINGRDKDG